MISATINKQAQVEEGLVPKTTVAKVKDNHEGIVVTYSELDAYRQCPLKHQWSYVDGWRQDGKIGTPLSRGGLWHNAMEINYVWLQRDPNADLAQIRSFIRENLLTDAETGEQNEDQVLVEWMLDGHHDCFGRDPQWEILQVESAHRVPLGPPDSKFFLAFKLDLLIRERKTNNVWLCDHKCCSNNTPVPTPQGVVNAGTLRVGDQVFGSDGEITKVTAVSHVERPTLELVLRNGQRLECSPEHVWPTLDPRGRTRREIAASSIKPGTRLIPNEALQLPARRLAIDPYVFGALLGDGSFAENTRRVRFTKAEPTVVRRFLSLLPAGTTHTVTAPDRHRSSPTYNLRGALVDHLRHELGIPVQTGFYKYIPEDFLMGSFEQRLELLRGLMDTDGSHRKGVPLYQTGSKQLAQDVARLVRSLGGVPTTWCNKTPKHQNGVGKPNWEVKMRFPRDFPVLGYHPAKLARWKTSHGSLSERLTVVEINELPAQKMVDIEVAADDHLFVVDGVLTHNSARDFSRQTEIDIDDQFGLYSWGLRQLGIDVMGTIRSDARTQRNKGPMAMDQRFRRVLTFRTQKELNRIAADAYDCARNAYSGHRVTYSAPAPDRCTWRCGYLQPHLMVRKGFDTDQVMSDFGFKQSAIKHREYETNPLLERIPANAPTVS